MSEARIPKHLWGDGPWQNEPDEFVWIDKRTGYKCRVWRSPTTGSLCGYVSLPKRHCLENIDEGGRRAKATAVWRGKYRKAVSAANGDYAKFRESVQLIEMPETIVKKMLTVEVHGGLTYAGAQDNLWTLGFDTAHSSDFMPAMRALIAVINRAGDLAANKKFIDDEQAVKDAIAVSAMETLLLGKCSTAGFPKDYKTIKYVKAQCRKLAAQLAAIECSNQEAKNERRKRTKHSK